MDLSNEEGEHDCPKCGKKTSNLRYMLLKVLTCCECTPQPEKPLGVIEYQHKTGGMLVICSPKEFKELKKPANKRR